MKTAKEVILHPLIQVLGVLIAFVSCYFGIAFLTSKVLPIWGIEMFSKDDLGLALFSAIMSASIMGTVYMVGKLTEVKEKSASRTLFFGMMFLFGAPVPAAIVSIPWGWEVGWLTGLLLCGLGVLAFLLALKEE